MAGQQRRGGRDVLLFHDVLDTAHGEAHGVTSIVTELVQFPSSANDQTVAFKATVTTKRGTFSAHGTARASEASQVQNRWYELGESRAVKRALIWATNTRVEGEGADEPRPRQQQREQTRPAPAGRAAVSATERITGNQFEAIKKLIGGEHTDESVWKWIAESTQKHPEQVTQADAAGLIKALQQRGEE